LVDFSHFVIDKIGKRHQVDGVYTDFLKAVDRVNHGLLCFDLIRSFSGMMLAWSASGPYGVLFFINNVDEVFQIFQHVSALGGPLKVLTIATGFSVS
jgi:hypothetical protein